MRIRNYSNITTEQFKSEAKQDLIMLAEQLNGYLFQFNTLFNKNIDVDNLKIEIRQIIVEVDSSGVPKTNIIVNKGSLEKLSGVIPIRVEKMNLNDPFITSAPFFEIREETNTFRVVSCLGFPANIRYIVTLLLI
ncbi:MAG: hypothetical protein ABIM30_01100 [candidate division WOR-3 bacterium]